MRFLTVSLQIVFAAIFCCAALLNANEHTHACLNVHELVPAKILGISEGEHAISMLASMAPSLRWVVALKVVSGGVLACAPPEKSLAKLPETGPIFELTLADWTDAGLRCDDGPALRPDA
jgi:hypothetical protein